MNVIIVALIVFVVGLSAWFNFVPLHQGLTTLLAYLVLFGIFLGVYIVLKDSDKGGN